MNKPKFLLVAYVHIENSSHQFSGESKGGGGRRPYGIEKKRGPERTNLNLSTDILVVSSTFVYIT